MKNVILFYSMFSIIFGTIFCNAAVTQIETGSFEKVADVIAQEKKEYGADEVLLVFDLDNTLLTCAGDLGSDVWYQWQTGKFEDIQPNDADKVTHLFDAVGLLYELAPMQPVEGIIPGLISNWQETGFTMMVLTSRGPNYRAATERELKRAGLNFAPSALAAPGETAPVYRYTATGKGKSAVQKDGRVNRREISYMNGVMMTAGMHKGSMLDHILEKTGRQFDAVVFVDDTAKNVKRMQQTFMNRDNIDVTIIHYTNVEAMRKEKNGAVLTSEQAENMAQQWRELNQTLEKIFPARKMTD